MDEQMTKVKTLALIKEERASLEAVLDRLSEEQKTMPGVEGAWSIKDLLAHITAWEQQMLTWIEPTLNGVTINGPEPGMTWDDVDRWNDKVFHSNKDRSLDEIWAESTASYHQALGIVEELDEEDLINPERSSWNDDRALWYPVGANTWWHYKEHRESIEAWLYRELQALMDAAMQAFGPFYIEQMRAEIQASTVPDHWFALNLARGCAPEPFTVNRFYDMFPYGARETIALTLDELTRRGMLASVDEDAYVLTDQGQETLKTIFDAAYPGMAQLQPLPDDQVSELNECLERLVTATLEAPEPKEKFAILFSRSTDPGKDAAPMVKTDQYLTDLSRFRDDAHLAAWKPLGVSGPAWEAFTFVWRGEARSADELAEKLPNRNLSAASYQAALEDLVQRGWLVSTPEEGYRITQEGNKVRQEAESKTDQYYYAPWNCLSADEFDRLFELLSQLHTNLESMAEKMSG